MFCLSAYVSHGKRDVRNADDFLFRNGGKQLLLELQPDGPRFVTRSTLGCRFSPDFIRARWRFEPPTRASPTAVIPADAGIHLEVAHVKIGPPLSRGRRAQFAVANYARFFTLDIQPYRREVLLPVDFERDRVGGFDLPLLHERPFGKTVEALRNIG